MSRFHCTEFDLLPERAFRPRSGRADMTLEGGKGSSAPAPDPRLTEAQIKSMGIQDQVIQGMLSQQGELIPMQKQQMQQAIDAADRAQKESASDREWILSRRGALSGLQDQLVSDAKSFNTEAKREELAGQAQTDINTAFAGARGQQVRQLASMGIAPGSGKSMALNNQMATSQALATAAAKTGVRRQAVQDGYALTDRATNALAGYPAMGMQATGAGAGYGGMGLDAANRGAGGILSGYHGIGQMAGQMGQNATGMFGAQAQYKSSQDQANQRESVGGILGGIGGAATGVAKLWALSDRRLKTDIEAVGRDAATGLTLYTFRYLADPLRRLVGVMADEVRQVMPAAVERGADGFDRVNYGLLGLEMVEA